MGEKLLKLPIGMQTFSEIRLDGNVYVDKTGYLLKLIDTGKVFFLSRPRRFGKSVTISTFDALFSGKKELFSDLYAEEYFTRPDYRPYPVVRMDMSRCDTDLGADELRASLMRQLRDAAERHSVDIEYSVPSSTLYQLLKTVFEKHGPVVVLVDEYDKPILDSLNKPEQADEYREVMRGFYAQIKAADEYLKFVFMTGITKFSKAGVFSAMNNLYDLSMDAAYSQMLGYTEEELRHHFAPYIKLSAEKFGISEEKLLDTVGSYYDGFSFDGVCRVYNPFSTLCFFRGNRFENYWFESGQPSYISDYIQTHSLNVERFRGLEVQGSFTTAHEIDRAEPASFLFQSGYLTLRERHMSEDFSFTYTLDYPNTEVFKSVMLAFVQDVSGVGEDLQKINRELVAAFDDDDLNEVVVVLNRVLASIPYNLFDDKEKYYHSLIYAMMVCAGVDARAEDRSKAGSADIVVHRKGRTTVIELKIASGVAACEGAAKRAMEQILHRRYYEKFPKESTTLLGLAVDVEQRCIGSVLVQRVTKLKS